MKVICVSQDEEEIKKNARRVQKPKMLLKSGKVGPIGSRIWGILVMGKSPACASPKKRKKGV